MGRAIDLFVTYRFLKILTTPFEKMDAYKFGIIDEKGNRIKKPSSTKPAVELATSELKNSYTILHKLVFNIKKIFGKDGNTPYDEFLKDDGISHMIEGGLKLNIQYEMNKNSSCKVYAKIM